ncbi:MAG: D-aminoacyl-tRNA deacylase [Eubacteriales bacterium]|nr:D-aminoacyl-tRNA deacylase [Clostridium sp.]MDY5756591.1 D-aminoacyl-tRNA deacylase [Eubacteriales bacterium]MDY6088521.1 D-aminoacyl-tRNA deacylase [Eubacteriales bacterium]
MKAVVQRTARASVSIDGNTVGRIDRGLLVLLGIEPDDGEADIEYMVKKCSGLRIFEDENGKMNLSVQDVGGSILLVSQFTLLGDARKGNRPSFTGAAVPEKAIPIYERVISELAKRLPVQTGVFGADMQVELVNDGPVTILLDSKRTY